MKPFSVQAKVTLWSWLPPSGSDLPEYGSQVQARRSCQRFCSTRPRSCRKPRPPTRRAAAPAAVPWPPLSAPRLRCSSMLHYTVCVPGASYPAHIGDVKRLAVSCLY